MGALRNIEEPLSFPVAPKELLEQVLALRQEHRRKAFWLSPWDDPSEHQTLNGSRDALVTLLLDDTAAMQVLQAIAEERPSLGLAEALVEARSLLKWS